MTTPRPLPLLLLAVVVILLAGCEPAAQQLIPTQRPTATQTPTVTPTRTPGQRNVTPTSTLTRPPASPTGGPSPTPLLGATATPNTDITATPIRSANAPRIEFFTSDVQAVNPGNPVTLFWSTRGVDTATIYRLDPSGDRNQLWNVQPDGSLTVATGEGDRGTIDFLIRVGEGIGEAEQGLSIPLSCPVIWFFSPPPAECPDDEPLETLMIEQPFVRGRMVYIQALDRVYVLFNDEVDPAWLVFQNRYNPSIHEAFVEGFPEPPGQVQPVAILGFVWRNSDIVRSRLGLGTEQEFSFDGFVQTAPAPGSTEDSLYISSSTGTVLQILPEGESWQIITLPSS